MTSAVHFSRRSGSALCSWIIALAPPPPQSVCVVDAITAELYFMPPQPITKTLQSPPLISVLINCPNPLSHNCSCQCGQTWCDFHILWNSHENDFVNWKTSYVQFMAQIKQNQNLSLFLQNLSALTTIHIFSETRSPTLNNLAPLLNTPLHILWDHSVVHSFHTFTFFNRLYIFKYKLKMNTLIHQPDCYSITRS